MLIDISDSVLRSLGNPEFATRAELEYPWMRSFATEPEKRERRKELIRELFRKNAACYGFLVCDFMNGVLIPMRDSFIDLLSEYDVWSYDMGEKVYRLTVKALELLIFEVPDITQICMLADSILKDSETKADRIADLRGKVKNWVEHGVVTVLQSN